MLKTLIPS